MAKTVFILGAGASKKAGAPLMAEFLDRARSLRSRSGSDAVQFDKVFEAIKLLRMVYYKSHLELHNIESVFGAFEMGRLIGRLGDCPVKQIGELSNAMKRLIVKTLELSIEFPVLDEVVHPPTPYKDFAGMVRHMISRDQDPPCTILTFNYDVALDYALHFNQILINYCIGDNPRGSLLKVLKLHGSVNWAKCEDCNSVTPWHLESFFHYFPGRPMVRRGVFNLEIGSKLSTLPHSCGKKLSNDPVIIPPTWNKTEYHGQLSRVWKDAAKELSEAENIFVIGYSFPESDLFFRYLFGLGTISDADIQRFWVFNPDSEGPLKARFKHLVGPGVERRYRFEDTTFEGAIPIIMKEFNIEREDRE